MKGFFAKHLFSLLSLVLLTSSLFGALYLVGQSQDTRNRAADESCSPIGKESCQENRQGGNTGFNCECRAWSQYDTTNGYWYCDIEDTNKCPTDSGGTDPSNFTCTEANAIIVGRCLKAVSGTLPVVNLYTCPGTYTTAGGCQQNVKTFRNVSEVCFENNFCGVQQIDFTSKCFLSTVDTCASPTNTQPTATPTVPTDTPRRPTATNTPRPTATITPRPTASLTPRPSASLTPTTRPSNTPTSTPRPTNTPTSTPTQTPTSTPRPTNTPTPITTLTPQPTATNSPQPTATNTPRPTSTLVPTQVIAQGPSPTQIILPQAGLDFPVKTLAIFGAIVSLLGFLILL